VPVGPNGSSRGRAGGGLMNKHEAIEVLEDLRADREHLARGSSSLEECDLCCSLFIDRARIARDSDKVAKWPKRRRDPNRSSPIARLPGPLLSGSPSKALPELPRSRWLLRETGRVRKGNHGTEPKRRPHGSSIRDRGQSVSARELLLVQAMNHVVSLSGMDAAFLALETPSTPMNILGTLVLDPSSASGGYSYQRVRRLMEERLPRLVPFRRRLVAVPFGLDHPLWVDDPDFHVRSHIYRIGAPTPGSEQVLANLVAQIAAQPLDRTRPLWELWVVEGLAEGRIALVLKLHHAVADGVSATQLLLHLLDSSPEGVDAGEADESVQPDPTPTRTALLGHALSRLPQQSARFARLLRDTARSVAGIARSAASGAPGGPRMPMPFSAPQTPWNGATSPQRRWRTEAPGSPT